jgi:hypothetical protein
LTEPVVRPGRWNGNQLLPPPLAAWASTDPVNATVIAAATPACLMVRNDIAMVYALGTGRGAWVFWYDAACDPMGNIYGCDPVNEFFKRSVASAFQSKNPTRPSDLTVKPIMDAR